MPSKIVSRRIVFVLLAFAGLITGILTGLIRIGWPIPIMQATLHHGALMTGGFLGTLICLEKVIPLKKKILYVVPVISGSSTIAFLAGYAFFAFLLLTAASAGLALLYILYLKKEKDLSLLLMLTGALCWLAGNIVLVINNFYPPSLSWWMGFLLFTITGERLELTKFLPVTGKNKAMLLGLLVLFLAGTVVAFHGTGKWLSGFSLIGISIWLMRFDIIRVSLRKKELPKYVAISLLTGYSWLMLVGIFLIILPNTAFTYDVVVHAFFIGFVFSMIFAHGPIILPGVLGSTVRPYSSLFYAWLLLLHFSLLTRIAGDLFLFFEWRRMSGLLTTTAIIGFFITMVLLVRRGVNAKAI